MIRWLLSVALSKAMHRVRQAVNVAIAAAKTLD
jgi:hypothetical protein